MVVLIVAGVHHFYALLSLGLCAFVTVTVVMEFYKGAQCARAGSTHTNFFAAIVELTHRNTRRYGGYLVHMGIVVMFIGFTGAAFNQDATVEVSIGQKFQIGNYEASIREITDGANENYEWHHAVIDVYKNGAVPADPRARSAVSTSRASSRPPKSRSAAV